MKGSCEDKKCQEGFHLWSLKRKPKSDGDKTPPEVSERVQNGSETSGDTKSDGRNVSSDDKSKKASDDKSQGFPKDFLDRLETTIMNIQQRQAQQQEQMEQMILAQKREKELQPPEWFLRWKMTA